MLLFLVDISLALHALLKFFLGIVCHARVYVRNQIRSRDNVKICSNDKDAGTGDRIVNQLRQYVSENEVGTLKNYARFAYKSLLAFSIAIYICSKIFLAHLFKTWSTMHKAVCRRLVNPVKYLTPDYVRERVILIKERMPRGKGLPQNVTIIVPCITKVSDSSSFSDMLHYLLMFLHLLGIKSVTVYLPFAHDAKLVKETTNRVKKFDNVFCIFSIRDSQLLMLEALDNARHYEPETLQLEPNDITKSLNGVHADMILVCGGLPCFYGYVPWHTKLSEAFFLPHVNMLMVEDVVEAFNSYLSIEKRFGK